MPTVTPFLWFDTQAEEAMNFYAGVFKRSKVLTVNRAQGKVMSVEFELEGQKFMALNAGPMYTFTEAISFFVACETQQEIDELWAKLTADGGAPSRCGWLKDKFGLSLADHPDLAWTDVERQGPGQITASHERDAADEQAGHAATAAGVRRSLIGGKLITSLCTSHSALGTARNYVTAARTLNRGSRQSSLTSTSFRRSTASHASTKRV